MLLLSALFVEGLGAQTIKFDAENLDFFQYKAERYQRWLDTTGIGTAVQVTKVRLKKDSTELELLLRVNATDLDTAIALWNRVKDDYLLTTGQPLEDQLFHTFAAFMDIPPEQGNVQVYVLDPDGAFIPCFFVGIWEEAGSIRTETRMRECKDKSLPFDISLRPVPLKKTTGGKTTTVERNLTSEQVFDKIETFLRTRYARTTCYDRDPELLVELRTETNLRISISNLCRVVLTDEANSPWCRTAEALGWKCTDIRRERLVFEFAYLSGTNHLGGRLDGKFGSGVYKPRTRGYLDMDPDFSDYIETFHLKFQQQLKTYLEKP